jgi:hypothetical protein
MVDLSEFCNTPEEQTLMMTPSHYSSLCFLFCKTIDPKFEQAGKMPMMPMEM